tara:strand:- start:41141 stop:41524 length:384 start_codon:yes stop_codon:yes gene_type:complete
MTILSDFEELFDDLAAADAFGSAQHTITFNIQGARVFDPATGKMTGDLPTVYTAEGWIVGSNEKEFKEWVAGDSVFIVKQSALGYKPIKDDRPVIASEEYSVIELGDDKAGGNAGGGVAYKIHLRGG